MSSMFILIEQPHASFLLVFNLYHSLSLYLSICLSLSVYLYVCLFQSRLHRNSENIFTSRPIITKLIHDKCTNGQGKFSSLYRTVFQSLDWRKKKKMTRLPLKRYAKKNRSQQVTTQFDSIFVYFHSQNFPSLIISVYITRLMLVLDNILMF